MNLAVLKAEIARLKRIKRLSEKNLNEEREKILFRFTKKDSTLLIPVYR